VQSPSQLPARLPSGGVVFQHTKLPEDIAQSIARAHTLVGFAHMPMVQREPEWLTRCALVVTVSKYCIELLQRAGVERLYAEPLYGVAEGARGDPAEPIPAGSPYLWDRRKFRDRALGLLEPIFTAAQPRHFFEKRPGLTLGIVSLIMPIKQFPLLFSTVAGILARHDVNLEIFGAGGYAQVRDLKAALAPIRDRTRFWGYHSNVAAVYPQLDYLLTGLPEKEALGLNVLEAQACGTPVLAPRAPPFTETVLEGRSGYLYRDPREDKGEDFENLMQSLLDGKPRPDPRLASNHLARFSYEALVERTARLLSAVRKVPAPPGTPAS
jgi:glycosyltransferase involved in cell wall biosynthesis